MQPLSIKSMKFSSFYVEYLTNQIFLFVAIGLIKLFSNEFLIFMGNILFNDMESCNCMFQAGTVGSSGDNATVYQHMKYEWLKPDKIRYMFIPLAKLQQVIPIIN
jgi:hypothetical protein